MQKLYNQLDTYVSEMLPDISYPFNISIEEFLELYTTLELSLDLIRDTEKVQSLVTRSLVYEYFLKKYIQDRSVQRIRRYFREREYAISEGSGGSTSPSSTSSPSSPVSTSPSSSPIPPRIQELLAIPQPEQKSQAWLDQRQSYITASVFGDAVGLKGPGALVGLLMNKISYGKYRPFTGNQATQWGEKYEDIANAIYCHRRGTEVYEFGMIAHSDPEIGFLGASTDGISTELINIEIKCPFSRFITGTPLPGYWAQMQLQMEVLNLDRSHFIECSLEEYEDLEGFFDDLEYVEGQDDLPVGGEQVKLKNAPPPEKSLEKGIQVEVLDRNQRDNHGTYKRIYLASPIHLYTDREALQKWHQEQLRQVRCNPNWIYIQSIPWVLKRFSCVEVVRESEWFQSKIPILQEFWREVKHYRSLDLDLDSLSELKDSLISKWSNLLQNHKDLPNYISPKGIRKSSRQSSPKTKVRTTNNFPAPVFGEDPEGSSKLARCLLDSDDESPSPKTDTILPKPRKRGCKSVIQIPIKGATTSTPKQCSPSAPPKSSPPTSKQRSPSKTYPPRGVCLL